MARLVSGLLGGWSGKPKKIRPRTVFGRRLRAAAWEVMRAPRDLPPAKVGRFGGGFLCGLDGGGYCGG